MSTIILDIDDVQMPWAQKVHEACATEGLTKLENLWTQWHMWEDYGCTKEEWLRVVDSLVLPGGVYHGEPYPGVVEAVTKLHEAHHVIWFVTARGFFAHSQEIRNWTREWCAKWYAEIPYGLEFSQNKGQTAKKLHASYAIDDSVPNVIDLENAGVETYLMNQPHNSTAQGYRRVDSVAEFAERILNGSRS